MKCEKNWLKVGALAALVSIFLFLQGISGAPANARPATVEVWLLKQKEQLRANTSVYMAPRAVFLDLPSLNSGMIGRADTRKCVLFCTKSKLYAENWINNLVRSRVDNSAAGVLPMIIDARAVEDGAVKHLGFQCKRFKLRYKLTSTGSRPITYTSGTMITTTLGNQWKEGHRLLQFFYNIPETRGIPLELITSKIRLPRPFWQRSQQKVSEKKRVKLLTTSSIKKVRVPKSMFHFDKTGYTRTRSAMDVLMKQHKGFMDEFASGLGPKRKKPGPKKRD